MISTTSTQVRDHPILSVFFQQRVLDLDYDLGRKSYEETEAEVQQLLRDHPDLPRAHFLRYLNSSHHGEFTGALDAVHRYFDYSMRRCARSSGFTCCQSL